MKKLSIYLNDDLEVFITSLINSGRYSCVEEIVTASLEDLREKEREISQVTDVVMAGESSGYKIFSIKEYLGFIQAESFFCKFSDVAIKDIRNIHDVLKKETGISYANKFLSELEGCIELFALRPGTALDFVIRGMRKYVYRDVCFYYKVLMGNVSIIRVIRCAT